MKLITHDGGFHADDVFAYAVLSSIPRFEGAELVRTRSPEVLSSATSWDIVFDVGFNFDPVRNRYDHHMQDKPLRAEQYDGTPVPYSSVGLIWRFFGEEYLLATLEGIEPYLERVWSDVDRTLILPIDMADNGVGPAFEGGSISMSVHDFNADWDSPETGGTEHFLHAVSFAKLALAQRARKALAEARATRIAFQAFSMSDDPRIIVLPQSVPWHSVVFEGGFTDALYVISEGNGQWGCQAVPATKGSFDQRRPLPAAWAGLRGADLAEASGVEDAIFCHTARFFCAASSLEGALSLAKIAVDHTE